MDIKNKKILKRGFILFAVLIVIFYILNDLCRLSVRNERYEIINHMSYLPEDNVDILVVGNSHAQEGLNADLLSDMLDAKVINFSFSQQQAATAYYFLDKNFKKQSPKVVVLEAYTLIQQVQGGYEFIPLSISKFKHLKMLGEEGDFLSSIFPIALNHNFWAKEKPFEPFIKNITSGKSNIPPVINTMVMSEVAVERHDTFDSQGISKQLFEYRFDVLKQIKQLCDKNNAELILTMLPLYGTLVERIDYKGLYYNKIKAFCDENSIPYYDFNKDTSSEWSYIYFREQDYTQNTHLNSYGQIKASIELSIWLASIFEQLNIGDYNVPGQDLNSFIASINMNNTIIIVDDCPYSLDAQTNPDTEGLLESYNISLKDRSSLTDEEKETPFIYCVSNGVVQNDYKLPETLDYSEDGITIYEIEDDGSVVRHAVARWDLFDSVIIIK